MVSLNVGKENTWLKTLLMLEKRTSDLDDPLNLRNDNTWLKDPLIFERGIHDMIWMLFKL